MNVGSPSTYIFSIEKNTELIDKKQIISHIDIHFPSDYFSYNLGQNINCGYYRTT